MTCFAHAVLISYPSNLHRHGDSGIGVSMLRRCA